MIDSVLEKANQDKAGIISLAEKARERNLKPFIEKAEKLKTELLTAGKIKIDQEYAAKSAELDMNRNLYFLEEQHHFINHIKSGLKEKIETWIQTPDYPPFFQKLLDEIRPHLTGTGIRVHLNPSDQKSFIAYLKTHQLDSVTIGIQVDSHLLGGLIIENLDRHILLDYTLLTAFENWFEEKKFELFQMIWEQK
ncbi:MAG: hypothetical protein KBA26_07915 [Candidatus Delongbacteria bacterium]|nr:hypothetical protein [Candidatus Delongbacteria bacterium]